MNKEMKRQLILIGILLCLLLGTLFLWYDNFMFHSYVNVVDYQYCYKAETEEFIIDGYEFYKKDNVQMYGGARIAALKDNFFLKGDIVTLTMSVQSDDEEKYSQKYKVKNHNEVVFFEEAQMKQQFFEEDFSSLSFHLSVERKKKLVYDEDINMKSNDLVIYNGSNKDYSIYNVYASSSWLKTGVFSSTIENIEKQYPYMTIDYLYLKEQGNPENIDDYERFAHLQGDTIDFLNDKNTKTAYYDGIDSLLDKKLICVISLGKDETQENMFSFMLELNGTMKAVDVNG